MKDSVRLAPVILIHLTRHHNIPPHQTHRGVVVKLELELDNLQ